MLTCLWHILLLKVCCVRCCIVRRNVTLNLYLYYTITVLLQVLYTCICRIACLFVKHCYCRKNQDANVKVGSEINNNQKCKEGWLQVFIFSFNYYFVSVLYILPSCVLVFYYFSVKLKIFQAEWNYLPKLIYILK